MRFCPVGSGTNLVQLVDKESIIGEQNGRFRKRLKKHLVRETNFRSRKAPKCLSVWARVFFSLDQYGMNFLVERREKILSGGASEKFQNTGFFRRREKACSPVIHSNLYYYFIQLAFGMGTAGGTP